MSIGSLVHQHVPDLEYLTADVLFGKVWQDDRLSKRDRSLITMAILLTQRAEGPLGGHMQRALGHGVTVDEIKALVTHTAFYAGWGCAETAVGLLNNLQIGAVHREPVCTRLCCSPGQVGPQ